MNEFDQHQCKHFDDLYQKSANKEQLNRSRIRCTQFVQQFNVSTISVFNMAGFILSHTSPSNSGAPPDPPAANRPLYATPTLVPPPLSQAPASFLGNAFLNQS